MGEVDAKVAADQLESFLTAQIRINMEIVESVRQTIRQQAQIRTLLAAVGISYLGLIVLIVFRT